jgi:LysR family glycine cleavage system transcriptional activator
MWQDELLAGRLVMPFDTIAAGPASYWLVCPQARRNVPKIRNFRDWLLAEVAAGQGSSSEPSP